MVWASPARARSRHRRLRDLPWQVGSPPDSAVRLTHHSGTIAGRTFSSRLRSQAASPAGGMTETKWPCGPSTAPATAPPPRRARHPAMRKPKAAKHVKRSKKGKQASKWISRAHAVLGAGGFLGSHLVPALVERFGLARSTRRRGLSQTHDIEPLVRRFVARSSTLGRQEITSRCQVVMSLTALCNPALGAALHPRQEVGVVCGR